MLVCPPKKEYPRVATLCRGLNDYGFISHTREIALFAMLDKAQAMARMLMADNSGQMGSQDLPGVMIVLVIAGVVGFVGIQVMSTVIDTTQLASGDPLYNASASLQTSVNDAWGLVGVAFIVVILAVIIVYLYGLRGGR